MAKLKEQRERESAQNVMASIPRVDRFAVRMVKKVGKEVYKGGKLFVKRVKNSPRKWGGAKLHGPPRQSASDCIFCFIGVFFTMLTLLKIGNAIRVDSKFDYLPSWYSSTLCIVFALTPAPVGQPRQIFCAHLWNMIVGIACRQIPTFFDDFSQWSNAAPDAEFGMPKIWIQALAVALGISGQAFIGILHPPATGMSYAFATNSQWSWSTILPVMIADGIVVVMGMTYLNLFEKKQYPLYWLGLGWAGSGGTRGVVRSKAREARRGVISVKEKGAHVVESVNQAAQHTGHNVVESVQKSVPMVKSMSGDEVV